MDTLKLLKYFSDYKDSSGIVEAEPAFIKVYREENKVSATDKLIKNPNGSLAQAANLQYKFFRDRQKRNMMESNFQSLLFGSKPEENKTLASSTSGPDLVQQIKALELEEESAGLLNSSSIDRESLPIYNMKDELIKAVSKNQFLIILGETGSGKSTQITQFLADAGFAEKGEICCTQPRRVAARSIAERVAEEFGCHVGEEVGYVMRFENCTSDKTIIKYVTEGILLRECMSHPVLKPYKVIMLDEAHERTIYTDVLFGLLKIIATRRSDLRIIVTSATLNATKFSEYFNDAPIFTIPGRTFDVKIDFLKSPELDFIEATSAAVLRIHQQEPPGDILVFLTGQQEIDEVCRILRKRLESLSPDVGELVILPAYAALSPSQLNEIFDPVPAGSRKAVVATNIAETSITINGIYYVVDAGLAKQVVFNPKTEICGLFTTPISQASAIQRAGRAGRTGPGKCYRLYTENAFEEEMWPTTIPEIKRTNFSSTLLQLLAIDVFHLSSSGFMDFPSRDFMLLALKTLHSLRAVDEKGITNLGKMMASFPVDPCLARMLIMSVLFKCSEEILTIVSIFSVIDHFQRFFYHLPSDKEKATAVKSNRDKFVNSDGDHLTFLAAYNLWNESDDGDDWCSENYVNHSVLVSAQKIRKHLAELMEKHHFEVTSANNNMEPVKLAICSGLLRNVARLHDLVIKSYYQTVVSNQLVHIHPSSILADNKERYLVYHELSQIQNQKVFMKYVMTIKPQWVAAFVNYDFSKIDWFNTPI
ncbi:ATP-dependent RNA helicase DHX8 [Microplitis demolitor]|uniref:ATP-dependent RNA helicase DHX8 n=1 Tax=Microplitis demolitor TaxID=69319 RepID=UPI0004CD11D7|nr:ATP-dependent RNA helicase DHX8 [Microplitis demolitor]